MGDTVAGVSLPPGNPGAIEDAAQGLKKAASGFGRAGDTARAAASSVSWTGTASEAFGARTGDYEDAGRKADAAAMQAAGVLTRFARRLEEGIDRVKRLQDRAQDAEQRMETATREAVSAGIREAAGRTRAASITVTDLLDVTGSSLADQSAALQEADDAAAERMRYEGIADRAREELEQLREDAKQEREAVKEAATSAAGELNGAQDGLPILYHGGMYGTAGGMEDRVLTGVRNGDYSVLEGLSMDTLDEDTQQAVGSEIAKDADQASYGEGDKSFSDVTDVVDRFGHDEDFAVGFYNQLGGAGTATLASSISMFQGTGEGMDDPALIALMAPYANMLGTATRSGGLRRGFTSGFLRRDIPVRDRYGGLEDLKTFVMAGDASNYGPHFLSEVGEEVLITPTANPDDQLGMVHRLSDHQDMMDFVAESPEAAGLLLAGRHGPDNHFSNVGPLMMHGREYTDDGAALGNLIQAGTHDLRDTNLALSNEASHMVIQGAPGFREQLPDGAKPALVTILDDHMDSFEYVAAERAVPNAMEAPAGGIGGLSYEQGHDYVKLLMGDDATRSDASTLIGERTAENMYQAAAREDTSYAHRAGALSEMGVSALGDAELDDAKAKDAANQMAQTASSKITALTPVKRVPGLSEVADLAFKDMFPTDAATKSMEDQALRQTDQLQSVKRLSIAMQIEVGDLPQEAMKTINLDGSVNVDFVNGPNGDDDVIMVDTDGDDRPDKPLAWDFNEDGDTRDEGERQITERQLYDAGLGQGEAAVDGSVNLREERFNAGHEPDIDELPLPDGYEQNNPSTFEEVWEWPFDAEGEGEFTNGDGDLVARQEDVSWDPEEKVFRVPLEGSDDELTYQRVGEDLVRVVKRDGTWVEAP